MELISSANGMSPAWSPDGRHIAFLSNRAEGWDLYIVDSTGGEPQRLTSGATADDPAWHPHAAAIAVERRGRIELIQIDGGARETLVENASQPDWSPDGQLAFVRNGDLWLRAPDGDESALLVDAAQPAWSPDGKSIAVARHSGVALVDPARGDARPLTDQRGDQSPAWRPRGDRLAFVRRAALHTLNCAAGEAQPLGVLPTPAGAPAYAPTSQGPLLAFHLHQAGNWNIAVANLHTAEIRLLTEATWISWNARA